MINRIIGGYNNNRCNVYECMLLNTCFESMEKMIKTCASFSMRLLVTSCALVCLVLSMYVQVGWDKLSYPFRVSISHSSKAVARCVLSQYFGEI